MPGSGFEQGKKKLVNYSGFRLPGNWWGKLIGGIIGLMRGGIVGAILGVLLGHIVDRFLSGLSGNNRTRDKFFCALFTTIGHISKEDGRVTKEEVEAAEALMQRLQLNEKERQQAIRFFQQGKDPGFDVYGKVQEFATQSKLRFELRVMFMELLLEAALSDGMLSVGEDAILERVRTVLKIPINVYNAMLRAREAEPKPQRGSGKHKPAVNRFQPLSQAYAALGLEAEASGPEVKKAYRKLVSQYHPDKLSSQGLPDEIMDMAKRRVYEINTAYNRIKSSRKK